MKKPAPQRLTAYQKHALENIDDSRFVKKVFSERPPVKISKDQKVKSFVRFIRIAALDQKKSASFIARNALSFLYDYEGLSPIDYETLKRYRKEKEVAKKKATSQKPRRKAR